MTEWLSIKKSNRTKAFFLLFFAFTGFLQAQENNAISKIEKVYLHTDRSQYFLGEDLWYKAYNVLASNNILSDNSNLLYVELISPDSKIIARNKTNLENGLGHGDFKIIDSIGIKPGIYQLRAYTNWNRNFDEDFVFKKEIEVIDAFKPQSEPSSQSKIGVFNRTATNNIENDIHIDFFPEGGSLLQNVASVVALKTTDSFGNPIEVRGEVFDEEGELISLFLSLHDGMGMFQIMPIKGKKYHAKIKTASGIEIIKNLPEALEQGYLIAFKSFKGQRIVSIKTNQETLSKNPNELLTVICKSKGISYLETTQTLTNTAVSFALPESNLPEGISQITLFDGNLKPQSERLIFVQNEQDIQVSMVTDKLVYKPNEKTIVTVSSKSKEGTLKAASFSLSITDMNGIKEEKDLDSNICSYFLMESDIRGKIHNPGYYFDIKNNKRLAHLDLLLLTQGWRDFLWKTPPKLKDSVSYKVEKGIDISGTVKQLFGEKPKADINITLALMNNTGMNIFNTVTDSLGVFKFENLMFSGKTNLFLNSRNEKGKNRGEILLNDIEQLPLSVDYKNSQVDLAETPQTKTILENVYKKYVEFGVAGQNILDEVEIIAKKKTRSFSLYGTPDFSYVVDENTAVFNDIYQMIQYTIPGVEVTGDSVRFMRFKEPAHIILNDFPLFDPSELSFILPDNVEKIDAIKGPAAAIFGAQGSNGVIAIYTKPGVGNKPLKEAFHSKTKEIDGFYNARIFYTPDPTKPNPELDNRAAARNTIYWNPYLHPDATGITSASFYNSSIETKARVNLEGITATGIPVVKHAYYTIEK
jgi:hypothetical protein